MKKLGFLLQEEIFLPQEEDDILSTTRLPSYRKNFRLFCSKRI